MFCNDINGCKLIEIAPYTQFSVWKVALLYVGFGRKTVQSSITGQMRTYIKI